MIQPIPAPTVEDDGFIISMLYYGNYYTTGVGLCTILGDSGDSNGSPPPPPPPTPVVLGYPTS